MLSTIILVVVAVGFAWNLGVHYTGAVMGMPYAARSIALWPALVLIAILTILGATFASGGVEAIVGQHIISDHSVTIADAIVIVLSAGLLTLLYNYQKIPTSTIQILVFCVVGVGLAGHIPLYWETIGKLAVVWVFSPPACSIWSCRRIWHALRSNARRKPSQTREGLAGLPPPFPASHLLNLPR
ncbi:MAG TPA: inorganic phosphate transporter [Ktedonobacteraceae bacterium]|nr:inorganic phosphate transporter [Ktedonobacteraceae bacterium]